MAEAGKKKKDAGRDIKAIQALLQKHEENLEAAAKSARELHGFLDRCAIRYEDELGVDLRSVIPKDPQ